MSDQSPFRLPQLKWIDLHTGSCEFERNSENNLGGLLIVGR